MDVAAADEGRTLHRHPRGLWVLAGTEFWDRISFHGMQALLVLYMVGSLLLPGRVEHVAGFSTYRAAVEAITGPLSIQALAAQTFGLYMGLIYFTPIIGGLIGDRITGRRGAVVIGVLLMTLGHFALAFDVTFLVALLLLILGVGLLRGNLSAQVKSLYEDGDRREADAFQLYYVAINVGAFIAPIITGALAAVYGWHTGFAFAGLGMMVGLFVYLVGQRHLPADKARHAKRRDALSSGERRRIFGLLLVWPVSVSFWIAQTQVWNVYNLWVRDHLDLTVGRFTIPVPWLQAIDGLAPVIMLPPVLALWQWQAARNKEPDALAKLAIGSAIFSAATVWLAAASLVSGADGRAPLLWAVAFHFISNLGWLYFTPILVTLFASKAPATFRGTLIGVNTTAVFAASLISGRIGGLYEQISPSRFWLIHAVVVGGGCVMILLCGSAMRALLRDDPTGVESEGSLT
jgi:POT family proton-dependent oligopeptide transporter